MEISGTAGQKVRQILRGRRGKNLREYLAAYLFIFPAVFLIFMFGIFPVGFALFVSMHKWRLKRGDFIGIENFISAVDDLAYVTMFALGIGAIVAAYMLIRAVRARAAEYDEKPWLMAIPGSFYAAALLAFIYWVFVQLPEVLDIANKIVGLEKTREMFLNLLGEAFRAESVQPAWGVLVWTLGVSVVVSVAGWRLWRNRRNLSYQTQFGLAGFSLAVGIFLLVWAFREVLEAYALAAAEGVEPPIWPHVIAIASGVLLAMAGWKLWRSAEGQFTNLGFWGRILGALILMTGAVLLVIYIPAAGAMGDKDIWLGLRVTVFYSLGTVPFQLAISLFLAILLFRKMRGSEAFRIIFFLPYVTPAVAGAAVFRQLFSNRPQAPANAVLKLIGIDTQQWLREPDGIFSMLAESIGFTLPDWAGGPSQALVVVMLYSIWTFVGYDIVIYLAGLGNIPTDLVESAEIDGAGKWHVFRHITFPLLSPTTYFLSLIAIIGTFKAFGHIFVLSLGEALGTTDTFSVVIFREFFEKTRYGYASAMAFVLFAIILSLTYVNNKIQGSRVFYG